MKKLTLFFLLMSLLSISCNKSGGGSSDDENVESSTPGVIDDPNDPSPDPTSDLPEQALTFDANIYLVNLTAAQEEKYNKSIEIAKLVVGTEEFRNKVLNHTYNGSKTFANNDGKTNAEIYQSILDAAEVLQPAKNNTMDLEIELYYANNSVVGYTNGGTTRVWVNTKFFNSYRENSVSGNLFHEWLHKLGYGHDSAATARRPHSVPYAIGYIMADIGAKFL